MMAARSENKERRYLYARISPELWAWLKAESDRKWRTITEIAAAALQAAKEKEIYKLEPGEPSYVTRAREAAARMGYTLKSVKTRAKKN